jgi:hypothetical protein
LPVAVGPTIAITGGPSGVSAVTVMLQEANRVRRGGAKSCLMPI